MNYFKHGGGIWIIGSLFTNGGRDSVFFPVFPGNFPVFSTLFPVFEMANREKNRENSEPVFPCFFPERVEGNHTDLIFK